MASASRSLPEVLDDLEVRFLVNLPGKELEEPARLFMQVEQAHWFYEDFYADHHDHLPHLQLHGFAELLFRRSRLLHPIADQCTKLTKSFKKYKTSIPVCGCVLLSKNLDKMVLVKGFYSDTWTFPKGKINEGEDKADCAVREVLEETGFDASDLIDRKESMAAIVGKQHVTLFCVAGVPTDARFVTRTRKEIGDIRFFKLNKLPPKLWLVAPFKAQLNQFIKRKRKAQKALRKAQKQAAQNHSTLAEEVKNTACLEEQGDTEGLGLAGDVTGEDQGDGLLIDGSVEDAEYAGLQEVQATLQEMVVSGGDDGEDCAIDAVDVFRQTGHHADDLAGKVRAPLARLDTNRAYFQWSGVRLTEQLRDVVQNFSP